MMTAGGQRRRVVSHDGYVARLTVYDTLVIEGARRAGPAVCHYPGVHLAALG